MKEDLVEELEIMGTIPKEQSAEAKRSIVDVAKKLIATGEISLA